MTSNQLYLFCCAAVLALLVFLYLHTRNDKSSDQITRLKAKKKTNTPVVSKEFEPLRQMGLVQEDEFQTFYLPVIEKINQYEKLINLPSTESTYFELLLTGLRQRRSVIFEIESAEANSKHHPYWTLALFLAILCRYTVRLLNSVEFRDHTKKTIIPYFESPDALYGAEKKRLPISSQYVPACVYLNIIEKIVPADVLAMLVEYNVYPFLVNAVTGCYQQRQLPFYTLIERVENHVLDLGQDDATAFKQTIKQVLKLIENNTITKNTDKSLVYESTKDLYIDRHLFWELFKTYSVFEERLISKRIFEQKLIKVFELPTTTLDYDTIQIMVSPPGEDTEGMDFFIEIKNLFCLPYPIIPDYVPHHKIRTKRIKTEREIQCRDLDMEKSNDDQIPPGYEEVEEVQIGPTKSELKGRRVAKQKQLFEKVKIN